MKNNNYLNIYKKFSFRNILNSFFKLFKRESIKNNSEKSSLEEEFNTNKPIKERQKFLKQVCYKEDIYEKALIDKVKCNPDMVKDMTIGDLQELNKAIANWRKHLSKQIEKVKMELKLAKINNQN